MSTPSAPSKILSPPDFPAASGLAELLAQALQERVFSAASLLLATPDRPLYGQCWGTTHGQGVAVTPQTAFDLASITKALVTAPLYMWACSRKRIDPDDPLSRFLPQTLVPAAKRSITLRQLLNHCSGLPSYRPYYRQLIRVPDGAKASTLLGWILETPLEAAPGRAAQYSDLGFLLLGMILELIVEKPLDQLAGEILFAPLGITGLAAGSQDSQDSLPNPATRLGYNRLQVFSEPTRPPRKLCSQNFSCAATEHCPWRQRLLCGEVHDENAYCLNGVAPHAGLFGTTEAIFRLLSFLWKVYRGHAEGRSWSHAIVADFWRRQELAPQSTWALGFDTPSSSDSSAGDYFSPHSVGHLGFTGTSVWLDLEQEVLIVLLTNRVYPTRDNTGIKSFRPLLHNLAMKAFYDYGKP